MPSEPDPSPQAGTNRFRAALAANDARPMVIAHRGDSSRAPENTLEAARLGHQAGAEAWEFDVHLTRDGVPIVIHDESLLRTTDVARQFADDPRRVRGYLVSEFELEEIRILDAGSWFVDPRGGPRSATDFRTLALIKSSDRDQFLSGAVRVPTLDEALELTRELDWLANIELKSFPNTSHGLLDAVLAAVDRTETATRVLISSFDHADVARAARVRPDIPTGVLVSTPIARPADYVREFVGGLAYHPSHVVLGAAADAYLTNPSAATLRTLDLIPLTEAGVPVLVYTVNDASTNGLAVHLAEAGVRGFFTDAPVELRQLFAPRRGE